MNNWLKPVLLAVVLTAGAVCVQAGDHGPSDGVEITRVIVHGITRLLSPYPPPPPPPPRPRWYPPPPRYWRPPPPRHWNPPPPPHHPMRPGRPGRPGGPDQRPPADRPPKR